MDYKLHPIVGWDLRKDKPIKKPLKYYESYYRYRSTRTRKEVSSDSLSIDYFVNEAALKDIISGREKYLNSNR